jgi:putative ABC transport system permease protein
VVVGEAFAAAHAFNPGDTIDATIHGGRQRLRIVGIGLSPMMGTVQPIYFGFAVIVAFGVVYNGARIALSERSRDLATLRVVGFTHREVATVLIGELALLTLLAIPVGLFIGSQFANLIVRASSTESVRLPLVLTPQTYATAALIVFLSSGFFFAVVSRRIRNLDLIGVLKARE